MGLFNSRDKSSILDFKPASIYPVEAPQVVNYDSVLDYLVGLSKEDYDTICKVAVIYRKANADAAAAQGIDNAPMTFIKPPENTEQIAAHVNHIAPKSFLDDEDDDADIAAILDEPEFIAPELPAKTSKRNLKIDVTDKK